MLHCRNTRLCLATIVLTLTASIAAWAQTPSRPLDLAGFGRFTAWADADSGAGTEALTLGALPADARCVGVVWNEERDVREIRVRLAGGKEATGATVQYWFDTWPPKPPTMPTIEDPNDDPWQGVWKTAEVEHVFANGQNVFRMKPLETAENPHAEHLPGVRYRRTLKVRLVLPAGGPRLESFEAFSETTLHPLTARIEFGRGAKSPETWSGRLEIHNGLLVSAKPWGFSDQDRFEPPLAWSNVRTDRPKGVVVELLAATPSPAGSNDITVVTVRNSAAGQGPLPSHTFSFSTLDLERGPIDVPDLNVFVAQADAEQAVPPKTPSAGKIRERLAVEPEQTFERASREIPPLDPWCRQGGGRVYLPVAADASWQKFAVEYGGDIFLDKHLTKAKGAELRRCQWEGNVLRFRFGTMRAGDAAPYYRDDQQVKVSIADDYLPIVLQRWQRDGLDYEEEAFATLLSGPLDPNDPGRSEQTPAVLLLRLRVSNPGPQAARAACVAAVTPKEPLILQGRRVYASADAQRLRMVVAPPEQATLALSPDQEVSVEFDIPAGQSRALVVKIPFVSDLTDADAVTLEGLDYDGQRQRVAQYWRDMVAHTTQFTTPEPQFNCLARSVVPHMHMSVTKDPKSGLYMVPAASYGYMVFANESCFQTLLLDALGDTQRAGQYLKTLTELQGSRAPVGNYLEPHDGFFHGARVDDEYDYTHQDYGLDQGTVLWTLAQHYFFTRDAQWLRANLPHMVKAVEWIERQRAVTRKNDLDGEKTLEYGLLPAGHLEDNPDWGYWFAINAYCVAGMRDMATAMKDIGHPDAEKLQTQAAAYLEDLRTAVYRSIELAPVVRMRDGTYSPYVPTRVGQRFRNFGPLRVQYYSRYGQPDVLPCYRLSATREVLYGPMIFLNLHLFEPRGTMANWILDDWEDNLTLSSSGGFNVHGFTDDAYWFSQGGMVFQANLQNPVLVYLQRNEAPAAIRGLYNGLVSCLYPEVHALTEEYRQWKHASGPFYKTPDEARVVNRIRDTLVLEAGDDLQLLPGSPRRWLTAPEGIHVARINSTFGPVAFSIQGDANERTITATISPPTRVRPKHLWLYVRLPETHKIASVQIDGKPWTKIDAAQERIELPVTGEPFELQIRYE